MTPAVGQSRMSMSTQPVRNDLETTAAALRLAGYVGVPDVDRCLADCPIFTTEPGIAYVDLLEAVEFDVVALVLLLSAVANRQSAGKETRFRLPRDPLARHILRLWRFPRAVTAVTHVPFRMLVESADLRYFGEKWPRLKVRGEATSARASVLAYLVGQQFFGLSVHRIDSEQSLAHMIDSETSRWRNYALVKLLDKVLSGQAIDVARVVLQELLANVVEHPQPSLAVIASQLDIVPHLDEDVPAALTISVWDDGQSIVETLRTCLREGKRIRIDRSDTTDSFTVEAQSWSPRFATYPSTWTPSQTAQDSELLLSSLFPGITRKAEGQTESALQEAANAPIDFGFGLFTVYRTVLSQFDGSVEARCEQVILKLNSLSAGRQYHVKVISDKGLPWLPGTVVTVRLPVHDA